MEDSRRINKQNVKKDDLKPLVEFGKAADRLEFPRIAEGGFIVLGNDLTIDPYPRKEEIANGKRAEAGKETGSAAGPRERSSSEAAQARAPAHAIGHLTPRLIHEELRDYGGPISIVRSSPTFCYVKLPVGLFKELPYRAELLLEIPIVSRRDLRANVPLLYPSMVPDIRAWSQWLVDGKRSEFLRSHHQYPDLAMCVCMPREFILERDPILTYVDFCILWIAKVLHDRELEHYPGLQHYGERARVARNRLEEYCGCGSTRSYRNCHMAADLALTPEERLRIELAGKQAYLWELGLQRRTKAPPA